MDRNYCLLVFIVYMSLRVAKCCLHEKKLMFKKKGGGSCPQVPLLNIWSAKKNYVLGQITDLKNPILTLTHKTAHCTYGQVCNPRILSRLSNLSWSAMVWGRLTKLSMDNAAIIWFLLVFYISLYKICITYLLNMGFDFYFF